MRRREFIVGLGGATAAWPLVTRAQQPERMRRIGVLVNGIEDDLEMQARLAAFRQGLGQLGWSEGGNIRFDYRFAGSSPERFPQFAKELIGLNPDVIFANSTPATAALRRETRTIPIVFVAVSDPIGSGVVASLARPGGNATGLLLYEDGIVGKWLGMLKQIAPRLVRAAIVANPKATPFDYFLHSAKAIGPLLGIEVVPTPVENIEDIQPSIELFARVPNGGLVLLPDARSIYQRDLIIALAARYRLPAVYAFRVFVTAGGLMSYSTDPVEQNRQAAAYVDRILRGTDPAELPVQAPTKYQTTLNLNTAKALGFTIPETLLATADEVIQ
jgi:putative tryptophan/tyrosine transport system substrate-binding protein